MESVEIYTIKSYDVVSSPGFSGAVIPGFNPTSKEYIRKKKITKMFLEIKNPL
jgi:hypothetical protein